jgi:predicted anti-sigma-YlaC factor YlaD
MRRWRQVAVVCLMGMLGAGCSIRRFAVNKVGDALASGGSTYESDDDLELVGDALPFGLKMIESLLAESPRHKGLLLTACQGFTTYSYIYVQQKYEAVATEDMEAAGALRARARRLYLRGLRYGFRGLEAAYPGITETMATDPRGALARVRRKKDVPLLYWNAAALGLAISVSKNDAAMLARIPEVSALLDRALELDESWQRGSLHEFEVSFASARPGKPDFELVERHYRRALELSRGEHAGLFVSYAESLCVPKQDRACFDAAIDKALEIDADRYESVRLQNLVAQKRAHWLRGRVDELFLPAEISGGERE